MKSLSGMRRPMRRGTDRVGWAFTFAAAAYNLVRLPKLMPSSLIDDPGHHDRPDPTTPLST